MENEELKKALLTQAFLMWHVDTFGIKIYARPDKEHAMYWNVFIADGPSVLVYLNKYDEHVDSDAEPYWL